MAGPIRLYFDVWDAADPKGTALGELTEAYEKKIQDVFSDTGSGEFVVNRHDAQAAAGWADAGNLVRVRLVAGGPFAWNDSRYKFAFYIEDGDDESVSEEEEAGEEWQRGGRGIISVLERLVWAPEDFTNGPVNGVSVEPISGLYYAELRGYWRWVNDQYGDIFRRQLTEWNNRPAPKPIPATITDDITGTLDSDGVAWPSFDGEHRISTGTNYLDATWDLASHGIEPYMTPAFLARCWVEGGRGSDKSATVAFRKGWNIREGGNRKIAAAKRGTRAYVRDGDGNYVEVTDSKTATDEGGRWGRREIYVETGDVGASGPVTRVGRGALRELRTQEDGPLTIGVTSYGAGSDGGTPPARQDWIPYTDYEIGDKLAVDIPGEYSNASKRLVEITIADGDNGEGEVTLTFEGSPFDALSKAGESQSPLGGTGGPTCRCLRLCEPGLDTDLILNLGRSSIKVSSEPPAADSQWWRESAVDGDDTTHWSGHETAGDPVAESFYGVDLHGIHEARAWRIFSDNPADAPQNVATEVRLYGTDDEAAWDWLPDQPAGAHLSGDPAANGWSLVDTYSTTLTSPNDSGQRELASGTAFRYWLWRAVSGGTQEWDVNSFELWASCTGDSHDAAHCDHCHNHKDLAGRAAEDQHPADAISYDGTATGSTADNVQERLDELVSITLRHLLSLERFLIIANRGDLGNDGDTGDSYPENTLEGFRQAAVKGVQGVEIDIQQTADKSWVAMHDTTVTRTTSSSGNVADKTDAQWAALSIDGGYGYNATRHGTSLDAPFLADIFAALEPYDVFAMLEVKGGSVAELVTFLREQGWIERVIVVCTDADATTIKGLDSRIQTMVNVGAGSIGDPNIDWLSAAYSDVTNLAYVTGKAPQVIHAYVPIAEFGLDESDVIVEMFERGVRSWETYDVDGALAVRRSLLFGGSVAGAVARASGIGAALSKYGRILESDPLVSTEADRIDSPTIFFDYVRHRWGMIYTGYTTTPLHAALHLAWSDDLLTWEKHGAPILSGDGSGSDSDGVTGGYIYYEDGTYYLFYIGLTASGYEGGTKTLNVATATDPAGPWTRYSGNPIISPSGASNWYGTAIWHPSIVKVAGVYYLFFNATGTVSAVSTERIGYATADELLGPWTVNGTAVLTPTGVGADWDGSLVGDPSLYRIGDYWYMSYYGKGTADNGRDGLAFTHVDDFPVGWTRHPMNPLLDLGDAGAFDDTHAHKPFIVATPGGHFHFYTAIDSGGTWSFGLATAGGPPSPFTGELLRALGLDLTGAGDGHGLFFDGDLWRPATSPEPLLLEDGTLAILENGHVAMSEPDFV